MLRLGASCVLALWLYALLSIALAFGLKTVAVGLSHFDLEFSRNSLNDGMNFGS